MKKLLPIFVSCLLVFSLFFGITVQTKAKINNSSFQNLKEKDNPSKQKDENGIQLNGRWVRSTDGKKYFWQLHWKKVTFSKGYRIYKSNNIKNILNYIKKLPIKNKLPLMMKYWTSKINIIIK